VIRAIIVKELRQHWLRLLPWVIGAMLLLAALLATWRIEGGDGFPYGPFVNYTKIVGFVLAPILCGWLVVTEYRGKTQLFLEVLPVSRALLVAVKYAIGLVAMLLIVGIGFATTVLMSPDALTLRHYAALGIRVLGFIAPWYSLFFAASFLGRYRLALYALLLTGFGFVLNSTSLDIADFGPLALPLGRFGFESWSGQAVAESSIATLVLIGLALTLGTLREGSVAALLAVKMSRRERVFFMAALLAILSGFAVYDEKRERDAYDLVESTAVTRGTAAIEIASGDPSRAQEDRALAERVADELNAMGAYLGLTALPRIFLIDRRDLDPGRFERAELSDSEGILLRSNLHASTANQTALIEYLIRESIIEISERRVLREPRQWILDGFATFWWTRNDPGASLAEHRQLSLRAVYGTNDDFGPEDLNRWLSTRERVGKTVAQAIAWSGLNTLARNNSPETIRSFLRAALAAPAVADVRGLWDDYRSSWGELLEESTGLDAASFVETWRSELRASRIEFQEQLRPVPRLGAELWLEKISEESRILKFSAQASPAPDEDAHLVFAYQRLEWFDAPLVESAERRVAGLYGHLRDHSLPGTLSRGDRVAGALRMHSEALGCEIISGWQRVELR
jgi:hypothetical protein